MATSTKFPTGNATVSGTWTNGTTGLNADDGTNASFSTTTKNDVRSLTVGTFGFDSDIPAGAIINSVSVEVQEQVTSGGTLRTVPRIGATDGTVNDNTTDTSLTIRTYSSVPRPGGGTWKREDLLNGTFTVRFEGRQPNNTTSRTYQADYVKVTVDYTDFTRVTTGPNATAVKDDFNRADAGPPPSASWTDTPGRSGIAVVNNLAKPSGISTNRISCWNTTQTGASQEVWCQVLALGTTNDVIELGLYSTTDALNSNGYRAEFTVGGNTLLTRRDGSTASQTNIATATTPTLAAGDALALILDAGTVKVFRKPYGSAWALISGLSGSDSTYQGALYPTLNLKNSAADLWRVDSFGAGAVPSTYTRSAAISATTGLASVASFWTTFTRQTALSAATAISTTGTVIPGSATVTRSAALGATSSIASTGTFWTTFTRTTALSATTSIASTATFWTTFTRSAALSAASSVTAQASFWTTLTRQAALSATTSVASVPHRELLRQTAISATTAIGSAGSFWTTFTDSAALTAASSIATQATFWSTLTRQASLSAASSITSDGYGILERGAALSASTSIHAGGTSGAIVTASASLSATTSIGSAGLLIHTRSAAIAAQTAVATVGFKIAYRSAAITATTSLETAPTRELLRSVVIGAITAIQSSGLNQRNFVSWLSSSDSPWDQGTGFAWDQDSDPVWTWDMGAGWEQTQGGAWGPDSDLGWEESPGEIWVSVTDDIWEQS